MTTKKQTTKQLAIVSNLEDEFSSAPKDIQTEEDAFEAADLLLKIRKTYKDVDDKRKERTAPVNATIKLINADYGKILLPLSSMEAILKTGLTQYASKRIDTDLKTLEEMRKKTGDSSLIMPIGLSSLPSSFGEVRFRKKAAIKIVDETKVPKKYFVIDIKAIEKDIADADEALTIPGVEVLQTSSLAIYTK